MQSCQALIQQGARKGELCGKDATERYCNKHNRQAIIDKALAENIKYCDIARGCFTILNDHEAKCTHCLHKSRIQERKREDKKRQDNTLCLDCARKLTNEIQAKGKHDKPLRRCISCYEKMQNQEKNRTARKRNYKAEAFINKHVIWNHYVKGAKKRGLHFSISKAHFDALISKPCFYCGYEKQGEVNGVDRVDNKKGYIEENVISCCEVCNILKGAQHPQEFIDKMKAIYEYQTVQRSISSELVEKWKTTYCSKTSASYKGYFKSANTRNLLFELSESNFKDLIKQPCYLCGLSGQNGIDRYDNSKGYLIDNCKSCCGHCNLMKKDRSFEEIIMHSTGIVSKYDELTGWISTKDILIRTSKIDSRVKMDHPEIQEPIPIAYKPLNEIIIPQAAISSEIQEMLEKKNNNPKTMENQTNLYIHSRKQRE